MIRKPEYYALKGKYEKIKSLISNFEFEPNGLYEKYQKWSKLPLDKKELLLKKWEAYFAECRESEAGKLLKEASTLYAGGLSEALKDVLRRNEELRAKGEWIKPPSSIDPLYLEYQMSPYFAMKSKLKELEEIMDSYRDIYETKRGAGNDL